MKKISAFKTIFICVCALAVFSACSVVPAKSYSPTGNEYFSFVKVEGGYSVAAAEGAELPSVLRFPEEYEGEAVTEVAAKGFFKSGNVEKIYIPKSYYKIGDEAFSYMPDLKRVYVGTVGEKDARDVSIGWGAFLGDESSALKSVDLADNVKEIGEYAFAWNKNLSSVTVGEGLETLADNAFEKSDNAVFSVDRTNRNFTIDEDGKIIPKRTGGDE